METTERNQLVVDNLPLVGYLVSDLCARSTHLSREDLASVGAIGLVLAADSFDPTAGVPFGAYARRRISGALLDELRSMDWAGRGTRQRITALKSMSSTLSAQLGRTPTDDEMAAATGLTREQVRSSLADAARTVGTLDDTADAIVADLAAPEDTLLARERTEYLRAAVASLPERLRLIVTAIYLEGKAVKDVAAELGLTSSAISQQRSEALRLLRSGLEAHYADDVHPGGVAPQTESGSTRRAVYLETLAGAVPALGRARTSGYGRQPAVAGSLEAAG
ncbi:FliA/WhiG family RNA polymerase sigma factor [Terrabacter aeriphilus]|uniref:FliA/WhiG family RNA polymerase sigma factor n=1 Tax=Terrabacter aeriphilus TaxID=515662 RepID=A0ABP9JBX9_9MICO